MSGSLDISACRGDSGGGATNKHLPPCLGRGIYSFQANTGADSNRGPVIRTGYEEMFGKGNVLKVGGPKE
jgi:hypothetical protein